MRVRAADPRLKRPRWLLRRRVQLRAVSIAVGITVLGGAGACGSDDDVSPDEAKAVVAQFLRLGQEGRFDDACGLLDATRYGDATLYEDLRIAVLGSLSSDAASPSARMRDLDRKRARATSCRGVLALIFTEIGDQASRRLVVQSARMRASWAAPDHTAVSLGRDGAWALTRQGGQWKIVIANALVDEL